RIAAPPHRLDRTAVAGLLQLVPQAVDVDLDDVRGPLPVRLPEVLAEHLAGDHLAGVPQEQFQQAELGRGQLDLCAGAVGAAGWARRVVRFRCSSPTCRVVGSGGAERRRTASSRAISSGKANGLTT